MASLFEHEVLGPLLHLFRRRNKLNRLVVELDNAMVDRQHFISGWTTIFSECSPLILNLAACGPVKALSTDKVDKVEHDPCSESSYPFFFNVPSLCVSFFGSTFTTSKTHLDSLSLIRWPVIIGSEVMLF